MKIAYKKEFFICGASKGNQTSLVFTRSLKPLGFNTSATGKLSCASPTASARRAFPRPLSLVRHNISPQIKTIY